jgi:hypothetical protein
MNLIGRKVRNASHGSPADPEEPVFYGGLMKKVNFKRLLSESASQALSRPRDWATSEGPRSIVVRRAKTRIEIEFSGVISYWRFVASKINGGERNYRVRLHTHKRKEAIEL